MVKRIPRMLLLFSVLFMFVACSTVAGLGKDIDQGDEVLQDMINKINKKMWFPG